MVTSPPYWGLRDYGIERQLGLERTPEEYVVRLVEVFREVWRVLRDDGTVWLNLGDCYANDGKCGGETGGKQAYLDEVNRRRVGCEKRITGLKPKNLVGIPWRVALALQADGWYLRSDIIWHKPNSMPESVKDRPTRAHEYVFLLSKSERYAYDYEAVRVVAQESSVMRQQRGSMPNPRRGEQTTGPPSARDRGEGTIQMRPLGSEKQRGHSRRHSGFNNRWDNMSKEDQCEFGRNLRDVWTIPPAQSPEAHFAVFPEALVEPCVLAGSAHGDVVLDPFGGTGTTVRVAQRLGRKGVALELSAEYCEMARDKTWQTARQAQMV